MDSNHHCRTTDQIELQSNLVLLPRLAYGQPRQVKYSRLLDGSQEEFLESFARFMIVGFSAGIAAFWAAIT